MNNSRFHFWSSIVLIFTSTFFFSAVAQSNSDPCQIVNAAELPEVNWKPKSDWINVKTDVTPKAIGDGKADDTKAIQAALNIIGYESDNPNRKKKVAYLPPGTYRITRTLRVTHVLGGQIVGSGRNTKIIWDGPETAESTLVPATADTTKILTKFMETPINIGDAYIQRLSGYIKAPTTGTYYFFVAGDNQSEVWLSTNADPANKKSICKVPDWTQPGEWAKYPTQKSAAIQLTAGQYYYIEAQQKEGTGGDHLAVGWQLPNGLERPIPASRVFTTAGGTSNGILRQLWLYTSSFTIPVDNIGSAMLVSDGGVQVGYYGIVWDGNNRASIGIDHAAFSDFENQIEHKYEGFINFKKYGLRFSAGEANSGYASSETQIRNCLFTNCKQAGAYTGWNNYINIRYEGCEFRDNNIGLQGGHAAQWEVQNCHFERSAVVDIEMLDPTGEIGFSGGNVIGCTSYGSGQFMRAGQEVPADCYISNWTNPEGAVVIGANRSSEQYGFVVRDLKFENPPSKAPPIKFGPFVGWMKNKPVSVIYSNCSYVGSDSLMRSDKDFPLVKREIPLANGKIGGSVVSAKQSFLPAQLPPEGKVFDAVKIFPEIGKGLDDTKLVQAIIDSASAAGNNAVAYFAPTTQGISISKAIQVKGSNFSIVGQGVHSTFKWHWQSPEDFAYFMVKDPQNITFHNLQINPNQGFEGAHILQTSTDATKSFATYDRIWSYKGSFFGYTNGPGIKLSELNENSYVRISRFNGVQEFSNSSRAKIISNFMDGVTIVRGDKYPKTGFAGMAWSNASTTEVHDDQDFVIGGFYSEDAVKFSFNGKAGGAGNGRITSAGNGATRINNYSGKLNFLYGTWITADGWNNLESNGTRPVDLLLYGHGFRGQNGNCMKGIKAGTNLKIERINSQPDFSSCDVKFSAAIDQRLSEALDDLRKLEAWNMCLNYGVCNPLLNYNYCAIQSPTQVSSISVSPVSITLAPGSSWNLKATVSPNTAKDQAVIWRSDNPAIVVVDSNGVITGISCGSTTVDVTTREGQKTATTNVTIAQQPTSVNLNANAMRINFNSAVQLSALVSPNNACNKSLVWSSNNPNVATVNATGLVNILGNGRARITATAQDGGKKDTCLIMVNLMTSTSNPQYDLEATDFEIFPNPAAQSAQINFKSFAGKNVKFSVLDILGKEVQKLEQNSASGTTQTLKLDLTPLPSAIYLVRMQIEGRVLTKKLIVNH